jgi:hypothetical protein
MSAKFNFRPDEYLLIRKSYSGDKAAQRSFLLRIAELMSPNDGSASELQSIVSRAFRLAASSAAPEKILAKELGLKVSGRPPLSLTEEATDLVLELAEDIYHARNRHNRRNPKGRFQMSQELRNRRKNLAVFLGITEKGLDVHLKKWAKGFEIGD